MGSRGSIGNIIAAICSFFYAGLGQLLQGRIKTAVIHFVIASISWFFFIGWLINIYSAYDAATYEETVS